MKDPQLTLEQQFQLHLMRESAPNLTAEQVKDLLIQAIRLTMIKDNVIKNLEEKL